MSLFQKRNAIFYGSGGNVNPFERPSMPLASLALDGVLGSGAVNDSGEQVDVLRGITNPTAYRCISVLATVVAGCTLEEIDRAGTASPWTAFENLQSFTAYEMAEIMVTHMAGWGNFFARKVTGRLSTDLVDLQPIFPGNVQVMRINGQKIFRVRKIVQPTDTTPNAVNGQYPNGGAIYEDLTEAEVFHIPFLGYDGLQGMSPVMAAAQMFGTTFAADRLAARFLGQGSQLSGIIKVKAPLEDQEQADALKLQWTAKNGGARNGGGVTVLDSETDYVPLTISPDALQFLQSRQWQMNEIARMFGVPLTMLSTDSTGYGDAIETQQVGFVTYTVRGYTDRMEQRLSREFMVRGRSVAFNLDKLMRGATQERYNSYNTAIMGGWMQPAEARANENYPVQPGLDYFQKPQANNGLAVNPPMTPGGESQEPPSAPAPDENDDNPESNQ